MSNYVREAERLIPLYVGETDVLVFEGIDSLGEFESIVSATVTVSLVSGTDPSPEDMLVGSPVLDPPNVMQKVTGTVGNAEYLFLCAMTTDAPRVLYFTAVLPVIPVGQS